MKIIFLFLLSSAVPLNETETPDLTMREDGKYDIMTQVSIMDEDLPRISLIKCTLSIPIANYTNPREFTYYTGKFYPTINCQFIDFNFIKLQFIYIK